MRSTGEIISQTVRNLLADAVSEDREALAVSSPRRVYTKKQDELADFMGISRPYMPRKIESGTWGSEDLDKLAIFFDKYPMDFVPGPNDDWGPGDEASEGARQAEGDRHQGSTPEGNGPENESPGADSETE